MLSGSVPTLFGVFTNLTTLAINNNYYDRDANHDAVIPASLASRFASIASKNTADQGDTKVPVVSAPQQLYVTPIAPFSYTVTISENSYAVAGTKSAVASG